MAKVLLWEFGLLGAAIGIAGAALFWIQQAQISGDRIWPMPALVLIEWALLGFAGMFCAIESARTGSPRWSAAAWMADGALLPMAILGGFLIGPMVFLTLLPLLGAAAIADWRIGALSFKKLGYSGIGAAVGLVVLLFFILIAGGL